MNHGKKTGLFLMAALFTLAGAFPAFATTTISTIHLKAKNNLESGIRIEDASLVPDEPGDGQAGVWTSGSGDHYYIDDLEFTASDSHEIKVGEELKVKVTLIAADGYKFRSSYSSSKVNLGGATYVSASRKSSDKAVVTIRLKGTKGEYDVPYDLEWSDSEIGKAKWHKPDYSSGYYEVILRRGGHVLLHLNELNATSFNFYPYMTQAGTYTFRVRTVPHTTAAKKYGKNSDWQISEEYELDEDDVSDGTGQEQNPGYSAGTGYGWIQQNYIWYYRYPDGNLKTDGWELIQGKWYYFDFSGKMQTGWLKLGGGYYFLGADGAMVSGWQNIGDRWYWFYDDPEAANFGLMAADTVVDAGGKTWYVDQNGQRASGWTKVGDHWSYFDPATGDMVRNQYVDTFYIDREGAWRP